MRAGFWREAALLLVLLVAACAQQVPSAAADDAAADARLFPPAPMNEQVLRLPGDPARPVTIEVTMFAPPGPGPFPLAVLNHGATDASAGNRGTRYRFTYAADYFLSRGYAVALPMARGFAESGGSIVHGVCGLDSVGVANARDLQSVINELRQRPDIDPSRIVVAGQSFGGWTTMALGTLDVPGLRGLIGFSPALRESDCHAQDAAMIAGAQYFGKASRLPSLWFYGENDTIMPIATWRGVVGAYNDAGGHARLVEIGRFMNDSHQMLSYPESLAIWTPAVDGFLAGIGLPSAETHPEYLPVPPPPPSHLAAVDDVAAVPVTGDRGQAAYRRFLGEPFPRAFVLGSGGAISTATGGFDPLARALAACRRDGAACAPYAVDGDVVWSGPPLRTAGYARNIAAGQPTVLDFAVAISPDCSSRGLPKLWISQPPQHGTTQVAARDAHPRFPPASPFAACNAALVPGVAVTYTPNAGFSGDDTMTFEETDVDGGHHVFHMALTVR